MFCFGLRGVDGWMQGVMYDSLVFLVCFTCAAASQ